MILGPLARSSKQALQTEVHPSRKEPINVIYEPARLPAFSYNTPDCSRQTYILQFPISNNRLSLASAPTFRRQRTVLALDVRSCSSRNPGEASEILINVRPYRPSTVVVRARSSSSSVLQLRTRVIIP